jgi:hypothetical protein
MPKLSIWFIRVALIYLMFGFSLGALLLWNKGLLIEPLLWRLLPAHMEFLLVGWLVQLAMGIAFWILPRWRAQRGNVRLAAIAFGLLNMGVWGVALAPWLGSNFPSLFVGRCCEVCAVSAFALHAWPRVKPFSETL